MGFQKIDRKNVAMKMVFFFVVLAILGLREVAAARVLNGERWLHMMPMLQRGPVPVSGRNPCSFIPGQSRGRCTLSNMEVAGAAAHGAPSAYPNVVKVAGFAAATMANETQKQDSSS